MEQPNGDGCTRSGVAVIFRHLGVPCNEARAAPPVPCGGAMLAASRTDRDDGGAGVEGPSRSRAEGEARDDGTDDAWHLTGDLMVEDGKGDPFAAAIRATRMPMIVTDPRRDDNPIVFVNDAFLRLTGYGRDEIMGRNCRFLQGPDTDPNAIQQLREAVDARRDIAVDILNYRKDGSPFWNALYMSPVITEGGDLHYFFASQLDVTDRVDAQMRTQNEKEHFEREVARRTRELSEALAAKTMLVHEVDHRVKNNLQMVASLLTMQTRSITDPAARDAMKSMLTRVEALGTVHKRLYQSHDVERFDVAEFARELATDLVRGSGRAGHQPASRPGAGGGAGGEGAAGGADDERAHHQRAQARLPRQPARPPLDHRPAGRPPFRHPDRR